VHCDPSFRDNVLAQYEAALAAIEQSGRTPTAWERQCLMSALCSIATDSWLLAEHDIVRSRRSPRGRPKPFPEVTVQGLRMALSTLKVGDRPHAAGGTGSSDTI
jgi:hypothetical protein